MFEVASRRSTLELLVASRRPTLESQVAGRCATLEFQFLFEPELLEAFLLEYGEHKISERARISGTNKSSN